VAELIGRVVAGDGGEPLVRDLLFHLPATVIDRRFRPPLYELPPSGTVTVEGTVERLEKPSPGRSMWRVVLAEGNAAIQLVYFYAQSDWLRKLFPVGARRIVSGQVEWFDMRPQIPHPEYVVPPERAGELPAIEPIYGLTAGLSPKVLRRAVSAGLERLSAMPEWLSRDLLAARGWPSFAEALRGGAQSGEHRNRRPGEPGLAAASFRRAPGKPADAGPRSGKHEARPRGRLAAGG
jgi:ATP-dependent DNA helicase RecG